MPYTPPIPFVNNTPVVASDIQDNWDALRYYIDRNILPTDIPKDAGFETPDIVRGEYYGVTPDHQFTSGELFTQNVSTETFRRSYMCSHFKLTDLTNGKLLQVVTNSGKKIIPEMDCVAIYTVSVSCVAPPNYQLDAQRQLSEIKVYFSDVSASGGIDNLNYNQDFIDASFGGAFTEDWTPVDVDNSGNTAGCGVMSRRWYCVRVLRNLTAGVEYNFALAVSPNCDKLYVSARNANLELFYTSNNI